MVFGVRIQTSPDGCAADPQAAQALCSALDAAGIALDRDCVSAKFLSQANGHSILQVRSTGFNDITKLD
jgi:hypothetical protein